MGTGSGVCAVFAAESRSGASSRWISIPPRCAARGINALLNHSGAQDRGAARRSVRSRCAGEQFDLILFNPPFLRGTPEDDRDRAWRSSDVAERFAAGLAAHLSRAASALVLLSTFGDGASFSRSNFDNQGFEDPVLAERRFVNETLTIFRLVPAERSVMSRFATCSAHQPDDHFASPRALSSRGHELVGGARGQVRLDRSSMAMSIATSSRLLSTPGRARPSRAVGITVMGGPQLLFRDRRIEGDPRRRARRCRSSGAALFRRSARMQR